MVDLASDMIGELLQAGDITPTQEQAARDFHGLYTANLADLGLSGYRSCLAGGIAGHDESDGDEKAVAAYNALRKRIGSVKTALLIHETGKMAGERPNDLAALRIALDWVNGA